MHMYLYSNNMTTLSRIDNLPSDPSERGVERTEASGYQEFTISHILCAFSIC